MKKYFTFKTLRNQYKILIALIAFAIILQCSSELFKGCSLLTFVVHDGILALAYIAGTLIADWVALAKE